MTWAVALAVAISWSDLPAQIRRFLGGDAAAFQQEVDRVEQSTRRRVSEGEWDHLIYYLLQGRAFTQRPALEPALSAREFVESGKVPQGVLDRVDDFLAGDGSDARMTWARQQAAGAGRERLVEEYGRAMRFLYEKEWKLRKEPGPRRRELTARLYQTRGHSSDTSADSVKMIETGLAVVKELDARAQLTDVLIVGPGVDLAPRTALRESAAPRSYQPDRVRGLLPEAKVECIDVNPRVVAHAGCVEQVNILTARRERRYDLIVITNVLVYFDTRELALALTNLRAMLKPGGFLLHNEMRAEVEPLARSLDLPVAHARSIRLGGSDERPLFDGVILHRLAD